MNPRWRCLASWACFMSSLAFHHFLHFTFPPSLLPLSEFCTTTRLGLQPFLPPLCDLTTCLQLCLRGGFPSSPLPFLAVPPALLVCTRPRPLSFVPDLAYGYCTLRVSVATSKWLSSMLVESCRLDVVSLGSDRTMVQELLQITASHDVLHSVMDSVLQSSHTLKFSTDSEHRSLGSVRFTVTGGARITSVTGHGVASWRSSPSEQSTLVEVFFKSSLISDTVLVLLNTELELVAETFSVPSVECEGSVRVLWCFFQAYVFGFFTHSATFVCIRIFSNTLDQLSPHPASSSLFISLSLCLRYSLSLSRPPLSLTRFLTVSMSHFLFTVSLCRFLYFFHAHLYHVCLPCFLFSSYCFSSVSALVLVRFRSFASNGEPRHRQVGERGSASSRFQSNGFRRGR